VALNPLTIADAARPLSAPAANRLGALPGGFADALRQAGQEIRLSSHAQKRIDRRELDLDAPRLERLNTAISSAAQKGARQSVVMLDDLAVVVNIRDRTVVTAMNTEGGKQRVFTNIDSVVIA
jgi:flagellar operon protein